MKAKIEVLHIDGDRTCDTFQVMLTLGRSVFFVEDATTLRGDARRKARQLRAALARFKRR